MAEIFIWCRGAGGGSIASAVVSTVAAAPVGAIVVRCLVLGHLSPFCHSVSHHRTAAVLASGAH